MLSNRLLCELRSIVHLLLPKVYTGQCSGQSGVARLFFAVPPDTAPPPDRSLRLGTLFSASDGTWKAATWQSTANAEVPAVTAKTTSASVRILKKRESERVRVNLEVSRLRRSQCALPA